jgi:hypothetical protein
LNSLERAKQFLQGKASRLALAIAPLAAVALSIPAAHAGSVSPVVFGTGANCSSSAVSGSASCTSVQEASTGGNANANWVAFFGSGTSNASSAAIDFGISGGSVSGFLPAGNIPVSWVFDLSSPTSGSVGYTLFFELGVQPTVGPEYFPSFTFSSSAGSNSHVASSGSISVPTSGTVLFYDAVLDTSAPFSYSVNIPSGSTVNVNQVSATTPEPTTLLMLPGAAAILFLRRRKRTA